MSALSRDELRRLEILDLFGEFEHEQDATVDVVLHERLLHRRAYSLEWWRSLTPLERRYKRKQSRARETAKIAEMRASRIARDLCSWLSWQPQGARS